MKTQAVLLIILSIIGIGHMFGIKWTTKVFDFVSMLPVMSFCIAMVALPFVGLIVGLLFLFKKL